MAMKRSEPPDLRDSMNAGPIRLMASVSQTRNAVLRELRRNDFNVWVDGPLAYHFAVLDRVDVPQARVSLGPIDGHQPIHAQPSRPSSTQARDPETTSTSSWRSGAFA